MDNAIGTDDELHCIRYSLLMPALAAAYVVALMPAVRLLLKEGVHSFTALTRRAIHMYFKN